MNSEFRCATRDRNETSKYVTFAYGATVTGQRRCAHSESNSESARPSPSPLVRVHQHSRAWSFESINSRPSPTPLVRAYRLLSAGDRAQVIASRRVYRPVHRRSSESIYRLSSSLSPSPSPLVRVHLSPLVGSIAESIAARPSPSIASRRVYRRVHRLPNPTPLVRLGV